MIGGNNGAVAWTSLHRVSRGQHAPLARRALPGGVFDGPERPIGGGATADAPRLEDEMPANRLRGRVVLAREAAQQVEVALRGLVDVGEHDAGEAGMDAAGIAVLGGDRADQVAERDVVPRPSLGRLEARSAAEVSSGSADG